MNKSELLERMELLGISPKRSLGQNFLVSENVVSKIIAAAAKKMPNSLIEIGPGLGSLTDHLRTLEFKDFLLIELDQKFAEHWRTQGLNVVEIDALHFDWARSELIKDQSVLVSNLPYQISSTLVMELSSIGRPLFKTMILMFQKEVAERINAKPETKEYGMLSVLAQNRWQIKKVVDAAPACFHPRPQVASRVLQFDYDESGFSSPQFLKFVKAGFQNRRKQVLKSLKGIDGNFDWTESLKSIGHPITARAEEISPLGWKALFLEHQQKVKLK